GDPPAQADLLGLVDDAHAPPADLAEDAEVAEAAWPALFGRAGGTDDDPTEEGGPRRLGDFRILREVGRGGMGVVYEAEQISLGRRVALKVLPFASALDRRQLQRFRTEAQAAGQLHHTHIVPVYSVGEDRGVHFYAMQFIDGRSVADLIHDLKQETTPPSAGETTPARNALSTMRSGRRPEYFRWVAEAGVQAAEALEHAHGQGVIHRDIKPANLIRDHAGEVWVTDFGLAQVRSDARLTATGDVVGTLRYMSPEQALRPTQVDHRSDVYSLGVTLYEMLTLRAAFPAEGREELLRQIADREPPSARAADRTVPPELDVIVRKAMAKEPADRFATAKDLADDLRRFLDNRPIRAKRPSLWQHTKKWARRHRHIVTTAVAGLIVTLAAATGVLLAKNRQLERAIGDKEAAERDARTNATQAQASAVRAEANFAAYLTAVSRILENLCWRITHSDEDGRKARRSSQEVLHQLAKLSDHLAGKSEIRGLKAMAVANVAFADFMLGDAKAAEPGFREAERLTSEVVHAEPADPAYRNVYGILLHHRAVAALLDGKTEEANDYWDRALAELRAGLAADPRHAACRFTLAQVIAGFNRARAKGAAIRPKETPADALALIEGLCKDYPGEGTYRLARAIARADIAEQAVARTPAAGAAELATAVADLRDLAAADPLDGAAHRELARRADGLAKVYFRLKRKPEAEAAFREALAAARAVVTALPNSANDQYALSQIAASLAVVLDPAGPNAAAAAEMIAVGVRALESAVFLEQGSAGYETYRNKLFALSLLQARTLTHLGRPAEAAEAVGRAVRMDSGTDKAAGVMVAQHYALLAQKTTADRAIPADRRAAAAEPYYQQALAGLKRSAERGYAQWETVLKAAVFAGLKDRPEFQAIVGEKK
ncbi:MAG TPA: serine/threonine-protein kinase, partial [Gemmataceae bacterium]|nr:serine/threonine-protein kinase [Gemmataceae bacterium]